MSNLVQLSLTSIMESDEALKLIRSAEIIDEPDRAKMVYDPEMERHLTEFPLPPSAPSKRSVLEAAGAYCAWCGAPDDLEVDHIIPTSEGGTNDPDNLQILCRTCHLEKHGRVAHV